MARSDPKSKTAQLGLKEALKLSSMVIERRTTIPVLSCARLSAPGVLAATDLDLQLEISFDGRDHGLPERPIVIPQHLFAAAVRDTDGSVVECGDAKGRWLRVGDNPSVKIAECPDDLPAASPFDVVATFELPAGRLASDLAAVAPAMSEEETRYYLMGMFWQVAGLQLKLAATDGARLHLISAPLPDGGASLPDSIVPRKAITVLAEVLSMQPGLETVRVEVGQLRARFTAGAVTLTTRLIDGTFPDYTRVIPDKAKGGIKVAARELIRPATLASRLLGKHKPCLVLRPKDGTVSAKSPEGVEIEARLDREMIGEVIEEIGFRHDYVIEAMAPFLGSVVTMAFKDSASPCRIEVEGDDRLLVILMPMRV